MNKSVDILKSTIEKKELEVRSLVVKTPAQRVEAIDAIKFVKEKRQQVVEFFKESKESAHMTWKAIVANEKSFTDKLDVVEKAAKLAIGNYDAAKERERVIEENRLREKAEADAAAEKKKLEQRAKQTKNEDKKAELLDQAASVAPAMVSLASKVEKQEGESSRKIWKYRIVDKSIIPMEYLEPDAALLSAIAKSKKGDAAVPGVEFYFEFSLAVRV